MNILLTGAGGAAAISVWKSLGQEHRIFMADMDPCAAGLYLVPPKQRKMLPSGASSAFVQRILDICNENKIDLLIPTVDVELLPIMRQKHLFEAASVIVPLSPLRSLSRCIDKFELLSFLDNTGVCPQFQKLNSETNLQKIDLPCFVKPRVGAGSTGAKVVHNLKELNALPQDGSYLIQELLSGDEYSVDVYVHSKGCVLAAVPRLRMKIDSGIAVASRTVHFPKLSNMAIQVAKTAGVSYVANIQFKADSKGAFKLLEINPRFPGTLPLTCAAGIDIPKILIRDLMNEPVEEKLMPFQETMVVRYWAETFISPEEWKLLCPNKPFA